MVYHFCVLLQYFYSLHGERIQCLFCTLWSVNIHLQVIFPQELIGGIVLAPLLLWLVEVFLGLLLPELYRMRLSRLLCCLQSIYFTSYNFRIWNFLFLFFPLLSWVFCLYSGGFARVPWQNWWTDPNRLFIWLSSWHGSIMVNLCANMFSISIYIYVSLFSCYFYANYFYEFLFGHCSGFMVYAMRTLWLL